MPEVFVESASLGMTKGTLEMRPGAAPTVRKTAGGEVWSYPEEGFRVTFEDGQGAIAMSGQRLTMGGHVYHAGEPLPAQLGTPHIASEGSALYMLGRDRVLEVRHKQGRVEAFAVYRRSRYK